MSKVRKTWRVVGMHCVHCEDTIRRALSKLDGLEEIDVSYQKGTVSALWDEKILPEEKINDCLKDAGYALARPAVPEPVKFILILAGLAGLFALLTFTPLSNWLNAFPVAKAGMGFGALFAVGLMTSLHCVAMCGGINIAQSAHGAQKGNGVSKSSILYNAGRVLSYTVIGGIVGALGQVFSLSSSVKAAIQIAAAAFMLLMALNLLGCFSWIRRLTPSLPKGLGARMARLVRGRSSFVIGLANGLMPCGPLQSMQLYALSTGSAWMGAMSMLCFGLGTTPLMLGLGLVSGRMNRRFAKPMRLISAGLVVLMGMGMLQNGLSLMGVNLTSSESTEDAVVEEDEVQRVYTELDYGSYPSFTVQAGVTVEWTIYVDESKLNGCNNEIIIPAYDMDIVLSVGENVITFTPEETGTIAYTCWMGMIRGSIEVVEELA